MEKSTGSMPTSLPKTVDQSKFASVASCKSSQNIVLLVQIMPAERPDSLRGEFTQFDERMRTQFDREGSIYSALGMVTPRQREILRLRLGLMPQVNEGQPWNRRQVAEHLHIKPSSVGSAERRGLRTLHTLGFPEEPITEPGSQMWRLKEWWATPWKPSTPKDFKALDALAERLRRNPLHLGHVQTIEELEKLVGGFPPEERQLIEGVEAKVAELESQPLDPKDRALLQQAINRALQTIKTDLQDSDPDLASLRRTFANLFQDMSDEEVKRFVDNLPQLTEDQERHLQELEEKFDKEEPESSQS